MPGPTFLMICFVWAGQIDGLNITIGPITCTLHVCNSSHSSKSIKRPTDCRKRRRNVWSHFVILLNSNLLRLLPFVGGRCSHQWRPSSFSLFPTSPSSPKSHPFILPSHQHHESLLSFTLLLLLLSNPPPLLGLLTSKPSPTLALKPKATFPPKQLLWLYETSAKALSQNTSYTGKLCFGWIPLFSSSRKDLILRINKVRNLWIGFCLSMQNGGDWVCVSNRYSKRGSSYSVHWPWLHPPCPSLFLYIHDPFFVIIRTQVDVGMFFWWSRQVQARHWLTCYSYSLLLILNDLLCKLWLLFPLGSSVCK